MLNQVTLAGALVEHVSHQLARGVELMVAREDDGLRLLLVVALADEVAVKNVQPAIDCPNLSPQIGRGVAIWIGYIAGTTPRCPG